MGLVKNAGLFSSEMTSDIKGKFFYVDYDNNGEKRLFFENAGGSLRLKSAVEADARYAAYPDCPERIHDIALMLKGVQKKGIEDVRLLLNAHDGNILVTYTASIAMYNMVRAVVENNPGQNVVTTCLEHPSSYDACQYYAERTGKTFKAVSANRTSGRIEVDEVLKHIDAETCLLSVMYASNLSGAIMDIETLVQEVKKINPNTYIIVDAVQHAPHGLIDLQKTPVDGLNFAPYKFFGNRGVAYAYVSERLSTLSHDKLIARADNDWELGSPTPSDYAAMTEIVNYLCWIGNQFKPELIDRRALIVEGITRIKKQEQALLELMLNGTEAQKGLRDIKGVTVHFDTDDFEKRDLILSLSFDKMDCTTATIKYREKGVIVYERVATSLYSKRMLEAFDLEGVLRVSPLHCHDITDVVTFLRATEALASA
ncbi:aminotransferase class V-fold PLP-dependent enzyme [Fusibacter ferrireducens]|uniref:Aminotransferase class V-fold PLP-dependent enzyme n=1 Tax=Fusibacter ferrireducens TaxID=2785058 RepID=A0ABR9ZX51_9FIRM|nr:aminotransferase class V-fold PLP-dependent enzyme [Fusibacter ferrireducens]MBF4694440.1 aminotransferase class V-fold PLP-dependent enzyme [Fusibacter ferrireducens]